MIDRVYIRLPIIKFKKFAQQEKKENMRKDREIEFPKSRYEF